MKNAAAEAAAQNDSDARGWSRNGTDLVREVIIGGKVFVARVAGAGPYRWSVERWQGTTMKVEKQETVRKLRHAKIFAMRAARSEAAR
jgi:hypothetical protein